MPSIASIFVSCSILVASLTAAQSSTVTYGCNPAHAYPNGQSCVSVSGGLTLVAPTATTEVVTSFTTYCPSATTLTYNNKTYPVTSATTLTITDCPCTVTRAPPPGTGGPVYYTSPVSPPVSAYSGAAVELVGNALLAVVGGAVAFAL